MSKKKTSLDLENDLRILKRTVQIVKNGYGQKCEEYHPCCYGCLANYVVIPTLEELIFDMKEEYKNLKKKNGM